MAFRKYEIEYKVKDRKTGRYDAGGIMTTRVSLEAESETNAIAKLKDSLPYKLAAGSKEWEIVKVTLK